MTVNQSVAGHRAYMEPFAGKAKLGSPAITFAGPPSGLTYLEWFMGNCTGCTIDFINIHWYSSVFWPQGLTGFIYNTSVGLTHITQPEASLVRLLTILVSIGIVPRQTHMGNGIRK